MGRKGPIRYAVMHRYSSSSYGPWEMGTTIELDPEEADWVNHDSPGTLEEVLPGARLVTGQPVPESKLKRNAVTEPDPEPEPEPAGEAGTAMSTADEGAPVATQRRPRARNAKGA